jgi:hypothetical protein
MITAFATIRRMIQRNERMYLFFNKYFGKTKESNPYVNNTCGISNKKASIVAKGILWK